MHKLLTPWDQHRWYSLLATVGGCCELRHRYSCRNVVDDFHSSCDHHRSSEIHLLQCLASDRSSLPLKLQQLKYIKAGLNKMTEQIDLRAKPSWNIFKHSYQLWCSTNQGHRERALWTFPSSQYQSNEEVPSIPIDIISFDKEKNFKFSSKS